MMISAILIFTGCSINSDELSINEHFLPLSHVIAAKTIPENVADYDLLTQTLLSPYKSDAKVEARYISETGGEALRDGQSWQTAWAGSEFISKLTGINDASENKIYLLLFAEGRYMFGAEFSMKNYVSIVGSWDSSGNGERKEGALSIFDGNNEHRVVNNSNLNGSAQLYGVTIASGNAGISEGGGMLNFNSSPTLKEVIFTENKAMHGGGMSNYKSAPTLSEVSFEANQAVSTGGGILNLESSPVFINTSFLSNATDGRGGGMFNQNASPTILYGSFSKNSAQIGGGMFNVTSSSHVHITKPFVSQVTFSDNTASSQGGGIANQNAAPTLTQVNFFRNIADEQGGGMYTTTVTPSTHLSSPALSQVNFSENSAEYGAGMHSSSSILELSKVLFFKNTASKDGAGMYNILSTIRLHHGTFTQNTTETYGGGIANDFSSLVLIHVTLFKNSATLLGGGLVSDNDGAQDVVVINSIFWENATANNTEMGQIHLRNNGQGKEQLFIYNSIVQHGITASPSGISTLSEGTGNEILVFSNNVLSSNPLLVELADNGGFMQTLALAKDSPAIDKGLYVKYQSTLNSGIYHYSSNAILWYINLVYPAVYAAPADAIEVSAQDLRGYSREGAPDLGAYEYGTSSP